MGLAMLPAALGAWLLGTAMLGSSSPAALAGEPRSIEMTIAYPEGGRWEIVHIAILLEDNGNGGGFAAVEAAARAERLARFPGAVELSPQVSAQYVTDGWKLEGHTATWYYSEAGKPQGMEGEYAAFKGGAEAWNYAGGTDFHFEEGGATLAGLSVCLGDGRDGQNTVGWRPLKSPTLAEACTLMTPGAPQEFDLQFSSGGQWTLGTDNVIVDLQSIAIHEFGHALGLKHSSVSASVMHSGYKRGTVLREPTQDDLDGLRALYGQAPPTPPPPPPDEQQLAPRGVVPALSRQ